MKKLSIIVPVYNVEPYIAYCLDSLCAQTYPNIEILLINDGSTDQSPLICEKYASSNKNIKLFHKPNGGLSDARNFGIDKASGDFLAFVDSDDYVNSDIYALLIDALNSTTADIAACDYTSVIGDQPFNVHHKTPAIKVYNTDSAMSDLADVQGNLKVSACNKVFARKLFKQVRFPLGRLYEDAFTTHKLFHQANLITYLPLSLYYYRQSTNSITRSPFKEKDLDRIIAHEERLQFFITHNFRKAAALETVRLSEILICSVYYSARESNLFPKNRLHEIDEKIAQYKKTAYCLPDCKPFIKIKYALFSLHPNLLRLVFRIIALTRKI